VLLPNKAGAIIDEAADLDQTLPAIRNDIK
jgi:hypothetical protein